MLQDNPKLVDISALSNLKAVYGELVIVWNRSLDNLQGMENMESASKVEISNNGNLATIKDLVTLKAYFK